MMHDVCGDEFLDEGGEVAAVEGRDMIVLVEDKDDDDPRL